MEIAIDGKLRERLLEEASKRIPRPPAEDEVTASMLAEKADINVKQARIILRDMVEDEVATVRTNGLVNGKTCKVYRYLEEK